MLKEKIKTKLEFAYDCAGATAEHVWENKTDYMLAYAIVLLFLIDRDMHRRIDDLEAGSLRVVITPKDFVRVE